MGKVFFVTVIVYHHGDCFHQFSDKLKLYISDVTIFYLNIFKEAQARNPFPHAKNLQQTTFNKFIQTYGNSLNEITIIE